MTYTDTEIQKAKEEAMRLMAMKGLALHRIEKEIYAVDVHLSYYLVSSSENFNSLWHDASEAMKDGGIKKLSSEEAGRIFMGAKMDERDKLRKRAIELALLKKGLALFHRGNELWGYNKNGDCQMLLKVEEDVDVNKRPSDEIWRQAIFVLEKE